MCTHESLVFKYMYYNGKVCKMSSFVVVYLHDQYIRHIHPDIYIFFFYRGRILCSLNVVIWNRVRSCFPHESRCIYGYRSKNIVLPALSKFVELTECDWIKSLNYNHTFYVVTVIQQPPLPEADQPIFCLYGAFH